MSCIIEKILISRQFDLERLACELIVLGFVEYLVLICQKLVRIGKDGHGLFVDYERYAVAMIKILGAY